MRDSDTEPAIWTIPMPSEAYDTIWRHVQTGEVFTISYMAVTDEDVGVSILALWESTDEAGDVVASGVLRFVR